MADEDLVEWLQSISVDPNTIDKVRCGIYTHSLNPASFFRKKNGYELHLELLTQSMLTPDLRHQSPIPT